VNAIAPSTSETPLGVGNRSTRPETYQMLRNRTPIKRFGQMSEIIGPANRHGDTPTPASQSHQELLRSRESRVESCWGAPIAPALPRRARRAGHRGAGSGPDSEVTAGGHARSQPAYRAARR